MKLTFFDKTLQAKLAQLKNPKKPVFPANSSINFFPSGSPEKKPFYSTFSDKFSHSFDRLGKTPETAQKRPVSSHYSSSKDLKSLEKDIEKLKKDNFLVSQKLEHYIQAQTADKGQNSFTFVNNNSFPSTFAEKKEGFNLKLMGSNNGKERESFSLNTNPGLLEENCNLEKSLKKANFLLGEKGNENDFLQKRLKEKEKALGAVKEEIEEISLKFVGFEQEVRDRDAQILELRNENQRVKSENRDLGEREANLRRFQAQYKIGMARQEAEKSKLLKEMEALKKGFEEKERSIYSEILNLKLEKKSLLGRLAKSEQETHEKQGQGLNKKLEEAQLDYSRRLAEREESHCKEKKALEEQAASQNEALKAAIKEKQEMKALLESHEKTSNDLRERVIGLEKLMKEGEALKSCYEGLLCEKADLVSRLGGYERALEENRVLLATNGKLRMESEALRSQKVKDHEKSKVDHEKLKEDHEKLKEDYEKLKENNEVLRAESHSLKSLATNNSFLLRENEVLKLAKEGLLKEKEALKSRSEGYERLLKENVVLKSRIEAHEKILKENLVLKSRMEGFSKDNSALKSRIEDYEKIIKGNEALKSRVEDYERMKTENQALKSRTEAYDHVLKENRDLKCKVEAAAEAFKEAEEWRSKYEMSLTTETKALKFQVEALESAAKEEKERMMIDKEASRSRTGDYDRIKGENETLRLKASQYEETLKENKTLKSQLDCFKGVSLENQGLRSSLEGLNKENENLKSCLFEHENTLKENQALKSRLADQGRLLRDLETIKSQVKASENLAGEHERLVRENSSLTSCIDGHEKSTNELNLRIQALEKTLVETRSGYESSLAKSTSETQRIQQENREIQSRLTDLKAENQRISLALAQTQAKLQDSEAELRSTQQINQENREQLQSTLADFKAENQRISLDLAQTQAKLQESEAELYSNQRIYQENRELESRLANLKAENQKISLDLAQTQAKLQESKAEFSSKLEANSKSETEIKALRADIQRLNLALAEDNQIKLVKSEAESLKTAKGSLEKEVKELNRDLESSRKGAMELIFVKERLEREIRELKKERELGENGLKEVIASLEAKNLDLAREINEYKLNSLKISETLLSLRAQIDPLTSLIQEKDKETSSLREKLQASQSQILTLESDARRLEKERVDREAELLLKIKDFEILMQEKNLEVERSGFEVALGKKEIADLKEKLSEQMRRTSETKVEAREEEVERRKNSSKELERSGEERSSERKSSERKSSERKSSERKELFKKALGLVINTNTDAPRSDIFPSALIRSRPATLELCPVESLDQNAVVEEFNETKNQLTSLRIEFGILKESSEAKSRKIEELGKKIGELEFEKQDWLSRALNEKEEIIRKMSLEQKEYAANCDRIRAELEQKLAESQRYLLRTTERTDNDTKPKETLEFLLPANLEKHNEGPMRSCPTETKAKPDLDDFAEERKAEKPIENEDEGKRKISDVFEFQDLALSRFMNNKRYKSRDDLKKFSIVPFSSMRHSLDSGLEGRLLGRLSKCRVLIRIYEALFNEILRGEVRSESFEGNVRELDQRTGEHVERIIQKMKDYLRNSVMREKKGSISLLSLGKEWENEGLELEFLKNEQLSPIVCNGNERLESLMEENQKLRLLNDNMESQLQQAQLEIQEFDSTEEKYVQQVSILKQELKRLELLVRETDSMFHEKEHIKTNLLKFMETAGSKKFAESEEYLKVLFSMLEVTEQEKESVLQVINPKGDRKKGFVSILFKR